MSQKWQKANIKQHLLCAFSGFRLQGHLSLPHHSPGPGEASLSLQTTIVSMTYGDPVALSTLFKHCFSHLVT